MAAPEGPVTVQTNAPVTDCASSDPAAINRKPTIKRANISACVSVCIFRPAKNRFPFSHFSIRGTCSSVYTRPHNESRAIFRSVGHLPPLFAEGKTGYISCRLILASDCRCGLVKIQESKKIPRGRDEFSARHRTNSQMILDDQPNFIGGREGLWLH